MRHQERINGVMPNGSGSSLQYQRFESAQVHPLTRHTPTARHWETIWSTAASRFGTMALVMPSRAYQRGLP